MRAGRTMVETLRLGSDGITRVPPIPADWLGLDELRIFDASRLRGWKLFCRNFIARSLRVPVRTEPEFDAGSPEVLFTGVYAVQQGRMYDIHPDGERFLMIKPAETTEEGLENQVILVENWFEELKRLVPTD